MNVPFNFPGVLAGSPRRGLIQWLWQRPYTVLATLILAGHALQTLFRKKLEWDNVYLAAGKALAHRHDLFGVILYTYPPFPALLTAPLAFLPVWLGRLLFFSAIACGFVYYIRTAWRISGGQKLQPAAAAPGREHLIFILGLACAIPFVLNSLIHLQTDLLIAALLMAGVAEIARGRFIRSAVWIGLSATFKATPLLFAPYLLWRRQWAAAALLILVFIGANLLPDIVHRPDDGGVWLTHWVGTYVKPITKANYDPGKWHNQQFNYNQSLAGTVRRWFGTRLGPASENYDADDLDPAGREAGERRWIFLLGAILVLVPVAYVMGLRRNGYPPAAAGSHSDLPDARVIECAVVMTLMLLFSPNSSKTHFCIVLLPAFCAARVAVYHRAKLARILLGLAVLGGLVSNRTRLPGGLWMEQVFLWLGVIMFLTLFLLWACLLILARDDMAEAPA